MERYRGKPLAEDVEEDDSFWRQRTRRQRRLIAALLAEIDETSSLYSNDPAISLIGLYARLLVTTLIKADDVLKKEFKQRLAELTPRDRVRSAKERAP